MIKPKSGVVLSWMNFVQHRRCGKVAAHVFASNSLMPRSSLDLSSPISTEAKNWAALLYVLTLFFSFLPGLVVFLCKKDDEFVFSAGKEALNWSITLLLLSSVLAWIPVLGWILAGLLYLSNLVCCILAALNASKGLRYRFPFALRLIA